MAISAVMLFHSDGDVRRIYDAVIDEMGVRDHAPPGALYHWCAPVPGGMRVCDLWESMEAFDKTLEEKIGPITAKHGLAPPVLQISPVHETIAGKELSHKGAGVLVEFDGDTRTLLAQIDEINKRMNVGQAPPEGLIYHWTTETEDGVRAVDHWRRREDFDRFVDSMLQPAMRAAGITTSPRVQILEVYNTIDKRVGAPV